MIYVDDNSPDGTGAAVCAMAQRDRRVRCIQRIGRRGLASACIEGMLASSAPVVAVIDADLQHDERLLPQMLAVIDGGDVDVVVGSRYVESGSVGGWDESRAAMSRFATRLARLVLKADLHDPMSGFFMIRHDAVVACVKAGVSGIGFKILLDLFATSPTPLRYRELPYQFRDRLSGESKLDTNVAWEYRHAARQSSSAVRCRSASSHSRWSAGLGRSAPGRADVLLFKATGTTFLVAQTAATMVAMTSNFALNNAC
jgi:dolichol-phosphate mannosyltransferase